jgi:hypothetical protein
MNSHQIYAPSTIAMSVYNLLSVSGEPMTSDQIYFILCRDQHPGLDMESVEEALKTLTQRLRYIDEKDGVYRGIDPARRFICYRDREDKETGEELDGWGGWRVRSPIGLQPIEDLMMELGRIEKPESEDDEVSE